MKLSHSHALVFTALVCAACTPASDEQAIRNTLDLFATNGVHVTPALEGEVFRFAHSIRSTDHMAAALEESGRQVDELMGACAGGMDLVLASEDVLALRSRAEALHREATALQVLAKVRHWSLVATGVPSTNPSLCQGQTKLRLADDSA